MIQPRPAYSAPFGQDALRTLGRVDLIEDITPQWAWGESTGAGIKVAVIDSGIDAAHPAVGRPVRGYVSITEEGDELRFDAEPHEDLFGHGTACAGIIRSAAPECELYSVRVLGRMLTGKGRVFAAALRWAVDNGMDVCNLSLGTTKRALYETLHEISDLAYFRNTILVTAANNMPQPSFPSVYASVISVAAHTEKDPFLFYYNPDPPVEFGAPGIEIRVAWLDGGYITSTGNSYAAPHLTGIVARILGKHPQLTVFQMKSILRALAGNVTPKSQ
ncbi:MAG TPA: S8 family serine peptidase [Chloroflexota bacterium]